MKFSSCETEKLKELSREYKKINPFATYLNRFIVESLFNNGEIFLSNDNLAYMITKSLNGYVKISDIYSRLDSLKAYTELLNKLSGKNVKYVGIYEDDALKKALENNGFDLVREHHQLIKILNDEKRQDINFRSLSEIESSKIFGFINLYAPDAKYEL